MSPLQRVIATGGILVGLAGVVMLMLAASVPAQTPDDLQRQISRIERNVDHLEARVTAMDQDAARSRVESFSRIAAAEREIEINRYALWGIGGGIFMQIIIGGMTLRKLNGRR